MNKIIVAFLMPSSLLAGCANNPLGGMGVPLPHAVPSAEQVRKARNELRSHAQSTLAKNAANSALEESDPEPGSLLIGTVGPFVAFEGEALGQSYGAYKRSAAQWHPEHPEPLLRQPHSRPSYSPFPTLHTSTLPAFL